MTSLRISSLCLLLMLGAGVHAGPALRELPDAPVSLDGADDPAASKVYIVALRSPSVAERQAAPQTWLCSP